MMQMHRQLPITVLLAVKNEEANLPKCLASLAPAERVILLDSQSHDRTNEIANSYGAEIVQFHYSGGDSKKKQKVTNEPNINNKQRLVMDAEEVVTKRIT